MADTLMNFIAKYGKVALILIIGLIVIKIALIIIRKALKKSRLDPVLHTFVVNGTKIVLGAVLTIIFLDSIGVKVSSIVAVLGVAGAAIALALKDSLGNVAGGIMLIATKPFSQGDYIDVGGTAGQVNHIDLLLTTLNTLDNKVISIPNGLVTTSIVTNYTREDTRRVDCSFGIAYDSNYTLAKEIMNKIAEESPLVFSEPTPFIGVASNGEHGINIDFRVWCKTDDYWDVKYYLEEKVKTSFDKEGIVIPFPQMDVHIKEK